MHRIDELQELFEVKDSAAWSATLMRLAQQLGYQHSLFGIVANRSVPLESAFLVSNYPDQWRSHYDQQRLHAVDPTVSHCLSSALPMVWESSTFDQAGRNEFYEQASSFGLRSGITLPIHGLQGEFGVMSFVAPDKQHAATGNQAAALAALTLLRDYAVESSRGFANTAQGKSSHCVKLTDKELECLKWVAAGKSSWEVSRILGRSEATINFHMANIMRKFDVQTRQQAVVKAIKQGLVNPF